MAAALATGAAGCGARVRWGREGWWGGRGGVGSRCALLPARRPPASTLRGDGSWRPVRLSRVAGAPLVATRAGRRVGEYRTPWLPVPRPSCWWPCGRWLRGGGRRRAPRTWRFWFSPLLDMGFQFQGGGEREYELHGRAGGRGWGWRGAGVHIGRALLWALPSFGGGEVLPTKKGGGPLWDDYTSVAGAGELCIGGDALFGRSAGVLLDRWASGHGTQQVKPEASRVRRRAIPPNGRKQRHSLTDGR